MSRSPQKKANEEILATMISESQVLAMQSNLDNEILRSQNKRRNAYGDVEEIPVEEKKDVVEDFDESVEDSIKEYVPKGKNWKYCKDHAWLTYKTQIPKDDLEAFLKKIGNKREILFFRAAHEKSDKKHPYEHTHCLVKWSAALASTNVRVFDYQEIHPNIGWVSDKNNHWQRIMRYMAKQDPANADLLDTPDVTGGGNCDQFDIEGIQACVDVNEAYRKYCKKASDASGIKQVWVDRPIPQEHVDRPNFPWHQEFFEFLAFKPDRRKVYWIWEETGNVGKSWMALYLFNYKLAYCVQQTGGGTNFSTIMYNAVKSGWDQKILIFDFPREAETKSIYQCIEFVCNRMVTTTKYQGGSFVIKRPLIVVLANFRPNFKKMSLDRWILRSIGKDKEFNHPLHSDEIDDQFEMDIVLKEIKLLETQEQNAKEFLKM